jgi:hypothetical protein
LGILNDIHFTVSAGHSFDVCPRCYLKQVYVPEQTVDRMNREAPLQERFLIGNGKLAAQLAEPEITGRQDTTDT